MEQAQVLTGVNFDWLCTFYYVMKLFECMNFVECIPSHVIVFKVT